jgi:hypothetical protein
VKIRGRLRASGSTQLSAVSDVDILAYFLKNSDSQINRFECFFS